MNLHAMGLNMEHESSFIIDRPFGSGDNLFLIFKTEASICNEGQWTSVPSGSFILYTKGIPQKYKASSKKYINHYIHFGKLKDEFIRETGIITNSPCFLNNLEEIENILKLLSREQISSSPSKTRNQSLLLEILFRKIAENQCLKPNKKKDIKHLEELTNLRSEMYSTPGKYNNIRDLATSVNLSLSHFQALYKQYFNTSCYDDLLNAKISSSKDFLAHSNLSVREIAYLCGYENDTCFMRAFKQKTGLTPSEYRNS